MYRDDEHLGDGYNNYVLVVLVVLVHEGALTCSQPGRTTIAVQVSIVTFLPPERYRSSALGGRGV